MIRFFVGVVGFFMTLGLFSKASAAGCIADGSVKAYFIHANGEPWLSPYSGVTIAPPGSGHSLQQYYYLRLSFSAYCNPNLSLDLSAIPRGIKLQLAYGSLASMWRYGDSTFPQPVLINDNLEYFVSASPDVAEGDALGSITILENNIPVGKADIALKVDKTAPTTLLAQDVLLQCVEYDQLKKPHIRVEVATAPAQGSVQSPLRLVYGFLADNRTSSITYGLYPLSPTSNSTAFHIYPKDYGKPVVFVRRDLAGNNSEISREFVFSLATVNSQFNKRLNKCILK